MTFPELVWLTVTLIVACVAALAAASMRGFPSGPLASALTRRSDAEVLLSEMLTSQRRLVATFASLRLLMVAAFVWILARGIGDELFGGEPWQRALAWAVIVLAFVVLAAGTVWLPAAVANAWGTTIVIYAWPFFRLLGRLLTPLAWCAGTAERFLYSIAGNSGSSFDEEEVDERVRGLISEGHRDATLEQEARDMIEGVIELGDVEVVQVMTPRTYMSSMHVGLSIDEAVKFVIFSGHTRVPVYDKNRDDIVGMVHLKDLVPELIKPPAEQNAKLADLLRPAQFVPETKRLDDLLDEFRRLRAHMAVVLDEYGGVSGLVTIEDILEEIVGEIDDEHDEHDAGTIHQLDERSAEVLARVRVAELNERLGTRLPEDEDFDTVGGYIFSRLGHIPQAGETIVTDGVRMTVIEATRRRIERVRVEVLDPSTRETV